MTISKQYITDEQTYFVSVSKPHINTTYNEDVPKVTEPQTFIKNINQKQLI